MSTQHKNQTLMQHNIHHCRTTYFTKKTNFVWSIENFWNICNYMDTLTSSDIEIMKNKEKSRIDMCINRERCKLYFYIRSNGPNPIEQINTLRYNIYIQGINGAVLCTNWKKLYFNNNPLYEVCIQTLRLNEMEYLPNKTLSVYFTFESFENALHETMYENIKKRSEELATRKKFADHGPDSLVTFLVDGKRLSVYKSLVCAASPVFDKILKKRNDNAEEKAHEEIEITDVKYNIFKLIILHMQYNNYIEKDFAENHTIFHKNILIDLLAAAHRFEMNNLKLMCEKHSIEYITIENAVTYLDIAITNNAVYLATYVKRFIKLYFNEIQYTTEFLEKIKHSEILFDIYEQDLLEENALYTKYNGE
ncbi:Ankyrin repeat and BTB/POZ domain-containing protein 2 [Cyphomyrmex costatus]|uniref:Ankyrin repeat and BTB/POZ domain-containing protein 2 n=1 Tax=Cyphomyrmex costatus TaxID=456900 RepID=A0A151IAB3_9HYME|nr:Ankyrin repeat and BTB/POZ domain-containing protein 2 [Cyphomyrmex costatus]